MAWKEIHPLIVCCAHEDKALDWFTFNLIAIYVSALCVSCLPISRVKCCRTAISEILQWLRVQRIQIQKKLDSKMIQWFMLSRFLPNESVYTNQCSNIIHSLFCFKVQKKKCSSATMLGNIWKPVCDSLEVIKCKCNLTQWWFIESISAWIKILCAGSLNALEKKWLRRSILFCLGTNHD